MRYKNASARGQESWAPRMIAFLHLRDPGASTDSIPSPEKGRQLFAAHLRHDVRNVPGTRHEANSEENKTPKKWQV